MDKVKIKDTKTGAVIEVKKALASDYIGTGRFVAYEEPKKEVKIFSNNKSEKIGNKLK